MADIALINPHAEWGKMKNIRSSSPPLGLLYIAAFLEKADFNVDIIDLSMVDAPGNSLCFSPTKKPRIVGITATTPCITAAIDIAKKIKHNHPDIFVVLGGVHATLLPEDCVRKEFIDCVVIGEGEYPFLDLCKSIISGEGRWEDTSGIAYNNGVGRVKKNVPGHRVESLDELPFPARDLIDIRSYIPTAINYKKLPSTPVVTTRGCPFKCTFCSNPVHGRKVRYSSVERVINELIELKDKYGIRDVSFWDDTFTLKKERAIQICEMMIKNKLDMSWSCATRVDRVDPDVLSVMKRAGCWLISFGVESGVERVREIIKKEVSEEQIFSAFKDCRRVGIKTRAFFMLGIPTETHEESLRTIEFAKLLNPDYAQFTLSTPYPGCELFDAAVSEGWQPPNWESFQTYPDDQPVYVPAGRRPEELMMLQNKAFKGFYMRPLYLLKRITEVGNLQKLKQNIKAFYHIFKWN